MLDFFKVDSVFKKRFEKVWMWDDWARENNIKDKHGVFHDIGIDIVALEVGSTLCAIQCKCYDENTILDMNPVNSFVSADTTFKMPHYILVCTGQINANALYLNSMVYDVTFLVQNIFETVV